VTLTFDLWLWKSIGFQTLLRNKYVPSLVKIHLRMLILECSQGYYAVKIWPGDIDLWPWKSIVFQTLIRTKYVPSLVKIHWRMLILECSQGCYTIKIWPCDLWPWQGCYRRTDGRTDGSVTISLCNFVDKGIIKSYTGHSKSTMAIAHTRFTAIKFNSKTITDRGNQWNTNWSPCISKLDKNYKLWKSSRYAKFGEFVSPLTPFPHTSFSVLSHK
jgi:hypothetical protein